MLRVTRYSSPSSDSTSSSSTARALYRLASTVEGRTVRDEWEDADENERVTFKVEARRVGILPYRIESVALSAKPAGGQ